MSRPEKKLEKLARVRRIQERHEMREAAMVTDRARRTAKRREREEVNFTPGRRVSRR